MQLPWNRPAREAPAYVDTPMGILGAGGVRFRTTEALLKGYAGPVVEAEGLGALVRQAEVWLRSPQTLGVLVLVLLLVVLPWGVALGLTLVVSALWALASPAAPQRGAVGLLRVLEHPVAQGLLYVAVLSALAASGRFGAMWAGLGGFIAFRLGAVEAVLWPLLAPALAKMYPLPVPDQILRALVNRAALRRGIPLKPVDAVERDVRAFWDKRERPANGQAAPKGSAGKAGRKPRR